MTNYMMYLLLIGIYNIIHPNERYFRPFAEWILNNHAWKSIVPEDKENYEEWTTLLKTKLDTLYPLFWAEFSNNQD